MSPPTRHVAANPRSVALPEATLMVAPGEGFLKRSKGLRPVKAAREGVARGLPR